jgi:hypothetical protein
MTTPSAATLAGQPAAAASAARSLPARIFGVVFSPRATYADVAARPRFVGVLAFIVVVGGLITFVFLSTEVGKVAMLNQQVQTMESFGVKIPEDAYTRMEQGINRARYTGAIFQGVTLTVCGLIVAGLSMAIFNGVLGGDRRFKDVFAIVAHSGVILTLSQLFGFPLAYARETMGGTTNLGVFAPFLDEQSFAARALGSVDLFILWWTVSLAIGLGVLYKKRTAPIATALIVIYVVIGVTIAAIKTAVAGA